MPDTKSDDSEIIENLDFLMSYDVLEEEANWETVEALEDSDDIKEDKND